MSININIIIINYNYIYRVAEHWVNLWFFFIKIKYNISSDNADMSNEKGNTPPKVYGATNQSVSKFIYLKD